MTTRRELSPVEQDLNRILNDHYMAPEVKAHDLVGVVEALVNENLAPAMARARMEALEEAAHEAGVLGIHSVARAIRALIDTAPPASIPVERVREVLTTSRELEVLSTPQLYLDGWGAALADIERRLGVPLDGAGLAHASSAARPGSTGCRAGRQSGRRPW